MLSALRALLKLTIWLKQWIYVLIKLNFLGGERCVVLVYVEQFWDALIQLFQNTSNFGISAFASWKNEN